MINSSRPILVTCLLLNTSGFVLTSASFQPHLYKISQKARKKIKSPLLSSSVSSTEKQLAEDLSDLTKETFFCLRIPEPNPSSTCTVECKRKDGKPLGFGLIEKEDDFIRRAFAFTRAPVPPGTPYLGACLVHIREIPFSYGKLGGSVWYAAVAFGQYLAMNPSLIRGQKILELGAGVGIPGLVAAKCGAESVTLTEFGFDGEVDGPIIEAKSGDKRLVPTALLTNLNYNARLNGCEDRVTVRHLDWYDYLSNTHVTSPAEEGDEEEDKFDLVVGSDLVNWEDDVRPLISTLKYFLSQNSDAKAIISLSNENRKALPEFLDLIRKEFTTVEVKEQSVVHFDEHPLLLITLTI